MANRVKPFPWVKVWTDILWDVKMRHLDSYAKWLWIAILAIAKRSPKQGTLLTQDIDQFGKPVEDSEFHPATVQEITKLAKIKDSDWKADLEGRYSGSFRELFTRAEFLVYVAIEQFKSLDMLTEHEEPKVFVVNNFAKRQYREVCPDQDILPSRHSDEQTKQTNQRKQTKQTNRKKKGPGSGKPRTEESLAVYEVYEHWLSVMNKPRSMLTRQRKEKIQARLNDGYSVEDLKRAIDGCKASPFHMGENERQTVYDDIELICRNGSKVEQFINYLSRKGGLRVNNGKPSNRFVAGESAGPSAVDPEAARRLEELRAFGRDEVPPMQPDADRAPGACGPGADPGAGEAP